jgi:hypothetical protein
MCSRVSTTTAAKQKVTGQLTREDYIACKCWGAQKEAVTQKRGFEGGQSMKKTSEEDRKHVIS